MFPPLLRALAHTFYHPHYHSAHELDIHHTLPIIDSQNFNLNQSISPSTLRRTPSASASQWSFHDLDKLAVGRISAPARAPLHARGGEKCFDRQAATMTRPRASRKAVSRRAPPMKGLSEAGTRYRKNQDPSPLRRWPHGSCSISSNASRASASRKCSERAARLPLAKPMSLRLVHRGGWYEPLVGGMEPGARSSTGRGEGESPETGKHAEGADASSSGCSWSCGGLSCRRPTGPSKMWTSHATEQPSSKPNTRVQQRYRSRSAPSARGLAR
jgi:hypothetical protein